MKELPPLAGWPTQVHFVHEQKSAHKKPRLHKHRRKTKSRSKHRD